MGKYGGQLVEAGRFHKPGFSVRCMTVGGDSVYLGGRGLGIAQVGSDGVRYFDGQQGLPQAEVEALAWLEPHLYIAYTGAIGRLDPQSGDFQLLASSRAVQPKDPLDGGRSYNVHALHADLANDCLWLSIYESVMDSKRSGIWRYMPEDGDFQRVLKGPVRPLARTDEGFLYKMYLPGTGREVWRIFNIQTGDYRTLDGVGVSSSSGIRQPPGWAYLDGGVIIGHGWIYTPDGESYQIGGGGWTQPVDRLGRGLVAVSFERRAFWYIEPKQDQHAQRFRP